MMTVTATWVGDLGTESRFNRFRGHVRDLFGSWAVRADSVEEEEDPFAFSGRAGIATVDAALEELACDQPPERILEQGPAEEMDFSFALAQRECQQAEPAEAPAQEPEFSDPDGDVEDVSDYPLPEDPYGIDTTASLFIAGFLHIASNVTKGLEQAMVWFPTFFVMITHLCRMLSKKDLRRRLVKTCYAAGKLDLHKNASDGVSAHVHKERWGTLLHAATHLLPLESSDLSVPESIDIETAQALCGDAWDKERFNNMATDGKITKQQFEDKSAFLMA